jgi:hypothetical protein
MTLTQYNEKSVSDRRILFEIDQTQLNTQWINAGAGVWYVNFDNLYPEVETDLIPAWFTVQTVSNVGSVQVNGVPLTITNTLLDCSNNEGTFFYDGTNKELYIHLIGGSDPILGENIVNIGVVYGYSFHSFTPVGINVHYEGRLLSIPQINKSRDPMYWGKIQFEGGSVSLNNADGFFDLFGEDNNIYGNETRVKFGYRDLDIADYATVFVGYADKFDISTTQMSLSFKDKRKQLSKAVTYACTDKNALEAIEELLLTNYGIAYNQVYYDVDQWEAMKLLAYNVTLNYTKETEVIKIIEEICASIFGLFIVLVDGRYSFKITSPFDASNADLSIPNDDILNDFSLSYDPSQVISSTKIGYNRDWTTSGSAYTFLTDTSQEADVFQLYKTYSQKEFLTALPDVIDAQNYSDRILEYAGLVRAESSIEVPIKYWILDIGDFIDIELNRSATDWLNYRKCEILSKEFQLDRGTIVFGIKKYGNELDLRVTTTGDMRVTSDGYFRRVG